MRLARSNHLLADKHPFVEIEEIEELARLTLLETVQLNRLHEFLPEIITVSFSH
ncbi:MAG: hypothetical protein HWQ38_14625 [Nostoc sp. NMS7]|uniref:hypothetical protein n=1 Tax=uncultured Nostoc sp. TaxID=340711 RepID=UPI0035CA8483|nr:hypothetical protein [Nostoc sp. NMS7]